MSLRQDKFIEALPRNGYNVRKTAKEVGYSDQYATHTIHSRIGKSLNWKDRLEQLFTPDMVKKDILQHKRRLRKENDNTNYSRMIELQSKILGMQVDKQEVKTEGTLTIDQKSSIINRIRQLDQKDNIGQKAENSNILPIVIDSRCAPMS
jgi:hypothetical protein